MGPADIATLVSGVVVALGGIATWVKVGRPRWRRFWDRLDGTFDAINGRDAYVDTASGRNVPALPPLTTRVANVEEAVIMLAKVDQRMDQIEHRQDRADEELRTHGTAIESLKAAAGERIATKLESAEMWRAVANADADIVPPDVNDD